MFVGYLWEHIKKAMLVHSFFELIMITLVITLKPDKWIIFLPILLFSLFYAGFGRSAESIFVETEGLERIKFFLPTVENPCFVRSLAF